MNNYFIPGRPLSIGLIQELDFSHKKKTKSVELVIEGLNFGQIIVSGYTYRIFCSQNKVGV